MLIKRSTPSGLVVSVADAKRRLRIDADVEDDDADIEMMIRTATKMAEQQTGRVYLPTEFEWRTEGWCGDLHVPVVPVREVMAVGYLDTLHQEATVPDVDWYDLADDRGATISFVESFAAPPLSARSLPVRVLFEAGYDDPENPSDDPRLQPDPRDVHMILLLVGTWYAMRETVAEKQMTIVPHGFHELAAQRRIYR